MGLNIVDKFSAILYEWDSLFDILFALLHTKSLLKRDFSKRVHLLPFFPSHPAFNTLVDFRHFYKWHSDCDCLSAFSAHPSLLKKGYQIDRKFERLYITVSSILISVAPFKQIVTFAVHLIKNLLLDHEMNSVWSKIVTSLLSLLFCCSRIFTLSELNA